MADLSQTYDGFNALSNTFRRNGYQSKGFYTDANLSLQRTIIDSIYRNSWVAAKVVDCFAEDMTKDGVQLKGLSATEDETLQKYLTEIGIWQGVTDALKWGRLYGGCLAYYVIDGQDPSTPLNPNTIAKGQFHGLEVFDRHRANPSPLGNEDLDEPMYYDLGNKYQQVHSSRVAKFIGVRLPYYLSQQNQYWGDSVLERIYERIVMRDNAIQNTGNMINRSWLRTVKVDGLRQILAAGGKAEQNLTKMFSLMRDIQDSAGITLMDNADTFQADSFTFAGLQDLLTAFDQDVAGASDIPMTRLYGQSPAGFSNGDADLKTYYDKVSSAQEAMLREPLTTIIRMAYQSCFGAIAPLELDFEFENLWRPNELEDRGMVVQEIGTIVNAANAGLIPTDKAMLALRDVGQKYHLFSTITDEDVQRNAGMDLPQPPAVDELGEFASQPDAPELEGTAAGAPSDAPELEGTAAGAPSDAPELEGTANELDELS